MGIVYALEARKINKLLGSGCENCTVWNSFASVDLVADEKAFQYEQSGTVLPRGTCKNCLTWIATVYGDLASGSLGLLRLLLQWTIKIR